jgi:subtilisin family serine protease
VADLGRWKLRRTTRRGRLAMSVGLCVALALTFLPLSASGQTAGRQAQPRSVKTSSDAARRKLDRDLLRAYDRHAKGDVAVFASVVGSPRGALAQLRNGRATRTGKASLVVGSIPTQRLLKLAGDPAVLSVRPITFRRDGTPDDFDESRRPTMLTGAARAAAVNQAQQNDVPYADAPPPRGSTFEEYRKLNVLDARTHNFTEAWNRGFTGKGSTAAVLDSGTDWGHPDLIGADVAEDASGWPAAFDPFGTVEWLVAPERIDAGLSWYVRTTAKTCPAGGGATCTVNFATRTGPSRNLPVPAGTAAHDYTFPSAWTKSGDVRLGSHPDDFALALYEERPAFLVTDPNRAGVYDTVYVDLNDDHDFGDEKPVTRQSPRSWRDIHGDGFVDLSGGMLYYISDGTGPSGRPVPGGLEVFGRVIKGAPGELVAWTGDFDPALDGHGTHCASNIVGQGVANGKLPTFDDLPGDGRYPGAVVGGAPHATMVPFGDIYFNFDFSTQFAYLLTTSLGVDISSNSYGSSEVDNDGLDAASQEADIWHTAFGGRTSAIHSTGNGGPGFGTTTSPSPVTGIEVGASTQFGGTGWDSIKSYRQVTDNDIANWSNRGPGATGANGVDLVADGAFSAGSVPVNAVVDGTVAWETWGGTSRSTPVVAGGAALVYQAYRSGHDALPENFQFDVKRFLKSGAKDLGYESYIQGAGSLDAGRAVRLARGSKGGGTTVAPDEWRPGDFHGQQFDAFPQLLAPGERDTQRFTLGGPGSYRISDRVLRRTDTESFDFTTSALADETPSLFNAPNYLIDISRLVRSHRDADLMVIRASYPYNQLDPNDDYDAEQQWRMVTYNWTDRNRDRRLWTDRDNDGTVDNFPSDQTNIDNNPIPDFTRSEVQEGEYIRFTYINQETNAYTNMVRSPRKRMADGVFLGFYHNVPSQAIPRTNFHVTIEFYENVDWSWVRTPRRASGSFTAGIRVPADAPYGMYDGAVVVSGHGQKTVVPVSVTVAATAEQDANGQITGPLTFGGARVAERQRRQLYNNGAVFDGKDWGWRAEAGDWRFYYFDVPKAPPAGTQFLANSTWTGPAPHNDIDTLIFGKVTNSYQLAPGSDPVFAPYALGTVGGSQNTNVGAGVWLFNTATGGPEELVTAPTQQSLHAVVQHMVNMQHDNGETHVPFQTTVGTASVDPSRVEVTTAADSGGFDVTFTSSLDLPGLRADAFGLSQPSVTTQTARQDDPNDPSTASVKVPFTLGHAGRVTISASVPGEDPDLFVVRDANGDGSFTNDEIVAASATPSDTESVTMLNPADGNYQVWVHGFLISTPTPFPLTIDAVQGNDLTVTGVPAGPVAADTPVTLHVAFNKAMTAGQDYKGELQLGPPTAPNVVSVPIIVHRR